MHLKSLGRNLAQFDSSTYQGQFPQILKCRWLVASLVFALLSFVPRVGAQIAGTGSIQGTITDPTGALVANASITITQVAT
jgi:hypothetical protein